MSAPAALVFVDIDGAAQAVGQLWASAAKGQQRAAFSHPDLTKAKARG